MPRTTHDHRRPAFPRSLAAAAIALGVGVLGYTVFAVEARLAPQLLPKNFGVVEEGRIYRSGRLTPAALHDVVEQHGIRTIVDLGGYYPGSVWEAAMRDTAAELGVDRYEFRLKGDGTGDPNDFFRAVQLIADPDNHPVLLHCAAGSERTGACIIFYRTVVNDEPHHETLDDTFRFKHDPDDNPRMLPYVEEWKPWIEWAWSVEGLGDDPHDPRDAEAVIPFDPDDRMNAPADPPPLGTLP